MERARRIAFAVASGTLLCAAAPVLAQPRCASPSAARGDLELSSAVVSALSGTARAAVCDGAELSVSRTAGGYRLTLAKEGLAVSRDVATIDDAVVWAESWLASDAPVTETASAVPPERAQPAGRSEIAPPVEHVAPAAAPGLSLSLSLDASIDRWSVWLGPEIAATWDVTPLLWLGFGLGGGASLDEGDQEAETERSTLRAAARFGVAAPLGPLTLRAGLGVGVAGFAVTRTDAAGRSEEEETGVFIGAGVEGAIRIAGPVGILFGVGGRWHVPEPSPDADDIEEKELYRLPELVGNAHIGLSWRFGGGT